MSLESYMSEFDVFFYKLVQSSNLMTWLSDNVPIKAGFSLPISSLAYSPAWFSEKCFDTNALFPNLVSSLLTGAHLMRRLFQKVGSIIIRHNYTASRYTWFWLNSKATAHVSFAEKRIPEYTASSSVCRINQRWGMLLEKCGLQK